MKTNMTVSELEYFVKLFSMLSRIELLGFYRLHTSWIGDRPKMAIDNGKLKLLDVNKEYWAMVELWGDYSIMPKWAKQITVKGR